MAKRMIKNQIGNLVLHHLNLKQIAHQMIFDWNKKSYDVEKTLTKITRYYGHISKQDIFWGGVVSKI